MKTLNLFEDNKWYTDEALYTFHETFKNDATGHMQNKTSFINNPELEETFLAELDELINQEFVNIININKLALNTKQQEVSNLIKDLLIKYEDEMLEKCKIFTSENELIEIHNKLKNDIVASFTLTKNSIDSKTYKDFMAKFEKSIEDSKNDIIMIYEFKFRKIIEGSRKYYKDEMSKLIKNSTFLPSEKLHSFNETVTKDAITKFDNERQNIPINKFREIIIKSLTDIFKEFVEENYMNTLTSPAIGIDLGTTNSCVAYYKPGRIESNVVVVPNEEGENTTPSCVFISTKDEVGINAKQNAYQNPERTIFSIKRIIGRKFSDENVQNNRKLLPFDIIPDDEDNPIIRIFNNRDEIKYYPEQIAAKILLKMKKIAKLRIGHEVVNAVITVPAYFNDAQKQATKDAGVIAGLNVLKIITEPTASAIAFKLNRDNQIQILTRDKQRKILIFDLGGGTFDIAVLNINKGDIMIDAYSGDSHLGGDDFDNNVIKFCIEEFRQKTKFSISNNGNSGKKAISRLRTRCEEQKRRLSSVERVNITVDAIYNGIDLNVELTRNKFEELNKDLFEKTIQILDNMLKYKSIDVNEINDVVLVGGSTRIPKIQELLSKYFKGKTLSQHINPDEAVAYGAAIQAAILNGEQAQKMNIFNIFEVCPLSLGVKVKGGFMSVIIERNSRVPIKITKCYETVDTNQIEVVVEVFEGEEIMVASNRLLGTFILSGIPPGLAGEETIDITFEMTEEAILHVEAKIISTGSLTSVEIKEHKGRLNEEILQRLMEQENLLSSY